MNTYQQSENAKAITTEFNAESELHKFDLGSVIIEPELESFFTDIAELSYNLGMHADGDNGNGSKEQWEANNAEMEKEASQRANIISRFFTYDDKGEQNGDITIITNSKKGITVCRHTGSTFMNDELNG